MTFMLARPGSAASFTAAAGGGNWNSGATWGNTGNDVASAGYPGAGDTAVIGAGNTVTVNGTTEACATLNINSTGICLNNGTLTISSALASPTSGGTLAQGAGASLNLNGTTTVTTLNASGAGNTISYGGAAQTVKAVAYQFLTLAGSGAKTMTSVTTINGDFTASGTCTATLAGSTVIGGNFNVNGATITTANATLAVKVTGTTTVSSGTLKLGGQSASTTFGDFIVNGGVFDSNGGLPGFAGNLTYSSGTIQDASSASGKTWTFSGTGKTISGTFTIPSAVVVSGSVVNNGTVGITRGGSSPTLSGAGTWTQGTNGSLAINTGTGITITTLDCAANTPNTVIYNITSGSSTTPKAAAYYNLTLNAASGWALNGAGLSIANNLTVNLASTISSWPANGVIGGALTYSATSGTTTFPAALSIGALNQNGTGGTLAVPTGGALTVTGTGVGTWTRSAGTFTANANSTVKFTGTAPDIGGSVVTTFRNLLIDSTATTATASGSGFAISTALTVNAGGQLDLSALSGSSLTMGAATSLTNSGTIKGSLVTGTSGKMFAGTDGGYGTNAIALTANTGDLTLASGTTINLDVNSTAAAANDKLVVGGTLTLNNTIFNLKAPGAGAAIDSSADYTLVTAGAISGAPVLNWVAGFVPLNTNNYSLIISGGTIKLHNTSVVPLGSPILSVANVSGSLTFSWDSTTFPGYSVQAETNSAGLGAGWVDTGSGTVSPYAAIVDPANAAVFYRLAHP